MSELVAIVLDSRLAAENARREFNQMQKEHLVGLEDSVIVYKDPKGHVKLDQTVNLTATGATSGAFWGALIGLIFSIPFGPVTLPLLTTALGAGLGAFSGSLSDYGINDEMMRELGAQINDGKAALFVLVNGIAKEKALDHLHNLGGHLLKTSLSRELEEKLEIALGGTVAGTTSA